MAALNNTAKGLMLDGFAAAAIYVSLHTADPGTTGTSEATGGTPAYARKSLSWAASSGGSKASNASMVFDVPAGSYGFMSYWSAVTAGTCYGGHALDAVQVFATQGTLTIASGALTETVA